VKSANKQSKKSLIAQQAQNIAVAGNNPYLLEFSKNGENSSQNQSL